MFTYRPTPHLLGADVETDELVGLDPVRMQTHVHILGPPDAGKTRLMVQLYQQLIRRPDATVILINPKGDLVRLARDAAIKAGQSKRLILFDPANREHVIGYNPLRPNGLDSTTHARAAREAIGSAFGQHTFDGTAQLARFLFLALCAARELELTLIEAMQVLRPGSTVRRQMLGRIMNPFVREALEYFDSLREARQEELAASTLARLEAFVMDDTVRRILTQQDRGLHVGDVIDNRQILLVDLQLYKPLRRDDVRLLGRLLINDIVAHVFARQSRRTPVFLLIDECHMFTTQDLCLVLDQGREIGLHCVLAHQHPGQLLDEDKTGLLYGSVMTCARTKMVFGGMSTENLEVIAKELFLCEFDPMRVKDVIHSLELEPVESRRIVPTITFNGTSLATVSFAHGKSGARTQGMTESEGDSELMGETWGLGSGSADQFRDGEIVGTTEHQNGTKSTNRGRSSHHNTSFQDAVTASWSELQGRATALGTGWSLGLTATPFYEYIKRQRVSSRTFEAFDEYIVRCMQRLQNQPKGHFVLKTPASKPMFVRAEFVPDTPLPHRVVQRVLDGVYSRPIYATPVEIADEEGRRIAQLNGPQERLLLPDSSRDARPVSYKRKK